MQEPDLFDEISSIENAPLSRRMRPQTLDDYVGQEHILGEGQLLRRAIRADRLSSLILYGPPGVGKTSLAQCISKTTRSPFVRVNAVSSNIDELRAVIQSSLHRWENSRTRTIFFIDEIHRFTKVQQDVLMPEIEDGHLILIGATVMNPFFSLISPLISRSLVFELKPIEVQDLVTLLTKALKDPSKGFGRVRINIDERALRFLAEAAQGDARKALNALEIAVITTDPATDGVIHLKQKDVEASIQKKAILYDRQDDEHYDTISAFIKSMRGSDPDATLYWLAKMLYAGEDPRFIGRRIAICAAEDVGNADPQAVILAQTACHLAESVGMPECRIPLAQAAVYVACAPKSNAVYMGIQNAWHDVENKPIQSVPAHLRDGSYKGAQSLERGQGYKYVHQYPGHYVDQVYMSTPTVYYEPTEQGYERKIKERLAKWSQKKKL